MYEGPEFLGASYALFDCTHVAVVISSLSVGLRSSLC